MSIVIPVSPSSGSLLKIKIPFAFVSVLLLKQQLNPTFTLFVPQFVTETLYARKVNVKLYIYEHGHYTLYNNIFMYLLLKLPLGFSCVIKWFWVLIAYY